MNLVQLIRSLAANQAALAAMTADEAEAVRGWLAAIADHDDTGDFMKKMNGQAIVGDETFVAKVSGAIYLNVWAWVENAS